MQFSAKTSGIELCEKAAPSEYLDLIIEAEPIKKPEF